MIFKEAAIAALVNIYRIEFEHAVYSLMVVMADPWCRSNKNNDDDDECDDAPCKDDLRRMLHHTILEGADNDKDEPCNTGGRAARVNATDMLDEARQEYSPPERGPLQVHSQ